jgi:hypothetical protein
MRAKLHRIDNQYFLEDLVENLIATSENSPYKSLSIKNCQSIELGYDLNELADGVLKEHNYETFPSAIKVFNAGFQKAIEWIGDKKFSEADIKQAIFLSKRCMYTIDKIMKELQKTSWDVEIIMEIVDYGLDEGGNPFNSQAKLDPNGCLILKIAK